MTTMDAALGVLALAAGIFLLYRTVQSIGQTSTWLIQWGLVICMVALAAVFVLHVGVLPVVTVAVSGGGGPSSSLPPRKPPPVAVAVPLYEHAGQFIRTGLSKATGWLSFWTSAPGGGYPSADSPLDSSTAEDRDL